MAAKAAMFYSILVSSPTQETNKHKAFIAYEFIRNVSKRFDVSIKELDISHNQYTILKDTSDFSENNRFNQYYFKGDRYNAILNELKAIIS